jgi:Putative beta barrel porin-7 (BBP7)
MKSTVGMFVAVVVALGICAGVAAAGEPPAPATASEAAGAIAQDTGYAGAQAIDGWQCNPVWRVRADAMWMKLSKPNDAVLVTDWTTGGTELLNASEFKFGYEAGCEVALWRQIDDDWSLEGRFFRIDGWNAATGSVLSPYGAVVQYATPFGSTAFPNIVAGSYRSELSNVEINGRRQINSFWSVLAGFRYLGLDDGLTITQNIGPGLVTGTHSIRAVDDLYGFQVGADMNLWSCGRLSIEGLFKAGVYGAAAANSVHFGVTHSSLSYDSNASAHQAAFAGEMSITGVYRFSKHVSLRGGYQFLWLEGVALASDQVAVSDPLAGTAVVSFKGTPSYDGAFVGLEFAH